MRLNAAHRTREKECSSWPTASARDWKGCYQNLQRSDGKMRGDLLPDAVKLAENGGESFSQTNAKVFQMKHGASAASTTANAHAQGQLKMGGSTKKLMAKCGQDGSHAGPPAPENPSTSGKSQELWQSPMPSDVTGGRLNPNWVEQLQGLPVGWTQLPTAWIDSDCSATESSPQPAK